MEDAYREFVFYASEYRSLILKERRNQKKNTVNIKEKEERKSPQKEINP
jgi:hypothetical protein